MILNDILICVECKVPLQLDMPCENCGRAYRKLNGIPIYLTEANSVFKENDYFLSTKSVNSWKSLIKKIVPSISVNLSRKKVLRSYYNEFYNSFKKVLVVGSGNQKSEFEKQFSHLSNFFFVYVDIDINAEVDLFCDANSLPFRNSSFDFVVVTAVLQHVSEPVVVVQEIYRVLNRGGRVYSEYAFLQHVIEGGYDFSRLTLVGHQRLFNRFSVLKSGIVAGPATLLIWYLENLFLLFFTNSNVRLVIKVLIRIGLFWIKYFDYVLVRFKGASDSASCTYIYASKVDDPIDDKTIIDSYQGNKGLKHV